MEFLAFSLLRDYFEQIAQMRLYRIQQGEVKLLASLYILIESIDAPLWQYRSRMELYGTMGQCIVHMDRRETVLETKRDKVQFSRSWILVPFSFWFAS
jgi:hypothetical protein